MYYYIQKFREALLDQWTGRAICPCPNMAPNFSINTVPLLFFSNY